MSVDEHTPDPAEQQQSGWGAQQPAASRPAWSARKTAAAVAIAVGIAAAGGVAIYAASGSAATDQSAGPRGIGPGDGGPGRGGPMAGLGNALHGEFVVSDGSGGYTTELLQTGEVTAVSATSITARSEDGYTKTYTIDAETLLGDGGVGDIANGDTVTVIATATDDAATAESITEGDVVRGGPDGQQGQPGMPPRRDGDTETTRPTK